MTYSYMQICGSIAEQLTEELTYSYGQVLDIEVIELGDYDELEDSDHFAVGFAAVSNPKEEHPVEAVVCLLKDTQTTACLNASWRTSTKRQGQQHVFVPNGFLTGFRRRGMW